MLAIGVVSLAPARLNHDRAIEADLFLETRVAVVPVGSPLVGTKTVCESLPGRDTGETQTGDTVHVCGDDDTMPVDGGGYGESVRDPNRDGVTLPPSQQRPRNLAVDYGGSAASAGEVHLDRADFEVEIRAGED